jgi:hypothetical protein
MKADSEVSQPARGLELPHRGKWGSSVAAHFAGSAPSPHVTAQLSWSSGLIYPPPTNHWGLESFWPFELDPSRVIPPRGLSPSTNQRGGMANRDPRRGGLTELLWDVRHLGFPVEASTYARSDGGHRRLREGFGLANTLNTEAERVSS